MKNMETAGVKDMSRARELWDKFSAILESTCPLEDLLESGLLKEIKEYFGATTPIGRYVNAIILKESETSIVELDEIRQLLHEEWDESLPKSSLRKSVGGV